MQKGKSYLQLNTNILIHVKKKFNFCIKIQLSHLDI